jgi:hypothetical protein
MLAFVSLLVCLAAAAGWGESSNGTVDGIVTNMHITDLELVSWLAADRLG